MDIIVAGVLGALIGFSITPIIKKYYVQPIIINKPESSKSQVRKTKISPPLLGIYDEKRRHKKIYSFNSDSWSDWILFDEASIGKDRREEGEHKGRYYRGNYTII